MLFRKNKGQGALEYLLLIGGAVLIAVIVIALLVGMGGQSRDTAQDQATKAQQSLDQPQPATIVNITPDTCTDGGTGNFTIQWQSMGQGGIYTLTVYDYTGDNPLDVNVDGTSETKLSDPTEPVEVTLTPGLNCEDTFWAEIVTEKNNQKVTSTRKKFNW
jgi:hypothetical protein